MDISIHVKFGRKLNPLLGLLAYYTTTDKSVLKNSVISINTKDR